MKTKKIKTIKKTKPTKDWFDSHVEVMGFGSKAQDKKLKALIKEQVKQKVERI